MIPAENRVRETELKNKIQGYIEADLSDASLSGLAEHLGYSSSYTAALVKRLYGKSFSKLLQEKRCAVAAEKLLNTDMSICEIINSVGYENESFFRRTFKEKYGKNPLDFRKRGKQI